MKDAGREIQNAMVLRVEGWQVGNSLDGNKMRRVFERLASEAGCEANTVSQLLNCARRSKEEQYEQQQARRRVCAPAQPARSNMLTYVGPDRDY